MFFSDSYFTIAASSTGNLKEKGSRFLSFAFPISNEKEIKDCLSSLKKLHPSANHHCYAWCLNPDKSAFRSSDDGEPANTAGKPIMSQIQSHDLTNILVVVVRYFGGTLLGVPGLIKAYKQAALVAISNSVIEQHFVTYEYSVAFNFEDINATMRILKEQDAKIISMTHEDGNTLIFRIKKQDSEKTEKKFNDLYNCKLKFLKQL